MALLELNNLVVSYGPITAIKGINIKVEQGQIVALLGANGAGKTSTLRTISGIIKAADGKILYRGQDITNKRGYKIARMGINQSPEGRLIFNDLSVEDNLKVGAYGLKNDKKKYPIDKGYQVLLEEGISSQKNKMFLSELKTQIKIDALSKKITSIKDKIKIINKNQPDETDIINKLNIKINNLTTKHKTLVDELKQTKQANLQKLKEFETEFTQSLKTKKDTDIQQGKTEITVVKNAKQRYIKNLERVYTLFPILKERSKQSAGTLSGGEQQMLAIGRALMASPKVLLLDEPSLGLAPLIIKEIFEALVQIKNEGTTILIVEQNALATLKISDYAYVLELGNISLEGYPKDLLNNKKLIDAYLGGKS